MRKKLLLIDGHAQCYQAFYAPAFAGGRRLTAPDGRPVNAVYIFATMLRRILKEHAPDRVAVAFDEKEPTFRHELYPEYKANRPAPPQEFLIQLPLIGDVLRAYGVPMISMPGYEADDIIGTLARRAAAQGMDVYLVMTDKDGRQLLGPHVAMINGRTGEVLTSERLQERDGLVPEQIVDVMALAGDPSDNVPGVPGIGEKTAAKLVREYGSLEAVLAAAAQMKPGRVRDRLLEHADLARLSRRLVQIQTDVPLEIDLDACRLSPDPARLRALFQQLGFRSLLEEAAPARPSEERRDYRLVDTPAKFEAFAAEIRTRRRFAFDLETTSPRPIRADLVGMAFSWAARTGFYLPLRAPEGEATLDRGRVLEALRPILSSPDFVKVGQNLKYDAVCMLKAGCELQGIGFDTMLAAYCLDPTRRRYGLDDLARDFLGIEKIPITSLIGKGKDQRGMHEAPAARVCEYACEDADAAWRLAEVLEPQLREGGYWDLFMGLEMPLVEVLAHMEFNGIGFDARALGELRADLEGQIARLEEEICREAGERFNIASPRQLAAILFEKLGLPVVKRSRTGPSTDADVLSELAIEHRLPLLVLEHRRLSKLLSTYVGVLPEEVDPRTGRIHASFNQTATATGRLSSSDPNLQNIPVRSDLGSQIRRAFVPTEKDALILAADYSQIELRILAHLSDDAALVEAFERGEDIHASVAAQVAGVDIAAITPAQRRVAKAVNFGIVYGQTPYGLSRALSIPVEEAEAFIRAYFERYAGVKAFIEKTIAQARQDKAVSTLRGRRRLLPEIDSSDRQRRAFAERAAVNTVVQGSAADMIKTAMTRIHRALRERALRTRMVLQVHDELVFETPEAELETVRETVPRIMREAERLRVPVVVDVGVGPNWLEAK